MKTKTVSTALNSSLLSFAQQRTISILMILLGLAAWGWFDVRNRARTSDTNPLVHKTDITVYTTAGAAMFDGRDPYEVANPRGWHYLYPPLFAILLAPLSLLPSTEQALVWYALSCLAVWGSIVELRRLWAFGMSAASTECTTANQAALTRNPYRVPPRWLICAASAGLLLPVMNCLQRGQVGIVLVYFLLIGTRLTLTGPTRGWQFLGGVLLALPVAIKLTPLLPVALLAGGLLLVQLQRYWYGPERKLDVQRRLSTRVAHEAAYLHAGLWCSLGVAVGFVAWLALCRVSLLVRRGMLHSCKRG